MFQETKTWRLSGSLPVKKRIFRFRFALRYLRANGLSARAEACPEVPKRIEARALRRTCPTKTKYLTLKRYASGIRHQLAVLRGFSSDPKPDRIDEAAGGRLQVRGGKTPWRAIQ
jgi:hypothetical protein